MRASKTGCSKTDRKESLVSRLVNEQWKRVVGAIWVGQAFSILTAYASVYAGIWYVTKMTDSAFMLAIAAVCSMLPQGLLSPFGGVIADRFDRRKVMIISDIFVGVMAALMGCVVLSGGLSVALVLTMGALRSAGQAFHLPAMESALPLLVPKKHLVRINTLNQSLFALALIVGPAFGIFLYETIGFQMVLFVNTLGCLCAVLVLMRVRFPELLVRDSYASHPIESLREGIAVVITDKALVIVGLVVMGIASIFAGVNSLFPLMTYDHFSGNGYQASLVEGIYGATSLIGMGILIYWGGGRRLLRVVAFSGILSGIILSVTGLLTPTMFVAFAVLTGISGVVEAFFNGPLLALVQKRVPEDKMGRVMGLFTTANALASPIGLGIAGVCAEMLGVALWFVIAGVFVTLGGLLLGYLPLLQEMDKQVAESFNDLDIIDMTRSV